MEDYKHIFVAGLHKSGTTVLANLIKSNPCVSGFENTGFPQDEGQFLQSVFPTARRYGGQGQFGFHNEMHLTERSPLSTLENAHRLRSDWAKHWDMSNPYLLEKSPRKKAD